MQFKDTQHEVTWVPEFLIAAQELLVLNDESYSTLARCCVHGTTLQAWQNISRTTRSLIIGGLRAKRAAVHFAVSLPGDTGRIAFGFRTGSRIYIFVDIFLWLRKGRAAYHLVNNVICVYGEITRSYINYVVDKSRHEELHVEHRDQ